MGDTVVIKDVDGAVYRRFKGEAVRAGLKIGDAASEAFRLWVQRRSESRVRDFTRLRKAVQVIDANRGKLRRVEGWSSEQAVRKWRELRRGW